MKYWDQLSTMDKVGEVLGAVSVFALPILMLFVGAAFGL